MDLETVADMVTAPRNPEVRDTGAAPRRSGPVMLPAPNRERITVASKSPLAQPPADSEGEMETPSVEVHDRRRYLDQPRPITMSAQTPSTSLNTVEHPNIVRTEIDRAAATIENASIESPDRISIRPPEPARTISEPLSPGKIPFVAARPPRAPAPADQPAPKPSPQPTISIGRIDVQFLPQDQPKPPPRAEPRRSHGFDTYARARRGEPR
jgi:hypothetical protein